MAAKKKKPAFKVGSRVRITRADLGLLDNGKPICGMFGKITKINGGLVMVKPSRQKFEIELFATEVALPDDDWWGKDKGHKHFVREAIKAQEQIQGWTDWEIGPDGYGRRKPKEPEPEEDRPASKKSGQRSRKPNKDKRASS